MPDMAKKYRNAFNRFIEQMTTGNFKTIRESLMLSLFLAIMVNNILKTQQTTAYFLTLSNLPASLFNCSRSSVGLHLVFTLNHNY
jgi:hypothetical protein